MLLDGKTLLVTGGNSGIGEAIVRKAATEGADVAIDYVSDPEETRELIDAVERQGGRAVGIAADVSKVAELERMIAEAVAAFGRLDVLVNNAGIDTGTSLLETTEEAYDHVMAVNLKSAFFATQLAARQFIAQGSGGVVINVSSVHEDWPMPDNAVYCVAKGGMRMLARNSGVELGRHGIRVVNVCPGAVATAANDSLDEPSNVKRLLDATPLGRIASPDDIADVVVFLASGRNDYMTASSVFLDGGLMQHSIGL